MQGEGGLGCTWDDVWGYCRSWEQQEGCAGRGSEREGCGGRMTSRAWHVNVCVHLSAESSDPSPDECCNPNEGQCEVTERRSRAAVVPSGSRADWLFGSNLRCSVVRQHPS